MDETKIIRIIQNWIRDLVVGLNLCPFAGLPLKRGKVRFAVTLENSSEAIYLALLGEIESLLLLPEEEVETSLLIVPQGLSDFDDYLDLYYAAEQALPAVGLDSQLQLASFHPDYCFEDADLDDPANYTNRSPFPMFHLIRQEPMSQALERYPNPEQIPEQNIEKLRQLGLTEIQRRLQACWYDQSHTDLKPK